MGDTDQALAGKRIKEQVPHRFGEFRLNRCTGLIEQVEPSGPVDQPQQRKSFGFATGDICSVFREVAVGGDVLKLQAAKCRRQFG